MKLLLIAFFGFAALAAGGEPAPDPVERSMHFVDQSLKATELFNASKYAEALPIFQDLLTHDADLDEDGYVALSIGDCLVALNRLDEARRAYQHAAQLHPDRKAEIEQRLIELALQGPITDDLLNRLRKAASAGNQAASAAKIQLSRALVKQAEAHLIEAVGVARATIKGGDYIPNEGRIQDYVAVLDELIIELKKITDQVDRELGRYKSPMLEKKPAPEPAFLNQHWRWDYAAPDQPVMKFKMIADKAGKDLFTANDKPLFLTLDQQQAIRLHQQRINAILLEATKQPTSQPH